MQHGSRIFAARGRALALALVLVAGALGPWGGTWPESAALATTAPSGLNPGPLDRERARFPICNGGRRITCVVDGDTIWYRGVKIRLADIDTPELVRPRCQREAELARRATARLQELLSEAPFRLEIPADGRAQDRFGRELRVIKRGEASFGLILVREGLARPWGQGRPNWCAAV